MISRRTFLLGLLGGSGAIVAARGLGPLSAGPQIAGQILGPAHQLGHLLRDRQALAALIAKPVSSSRETNVAIVGGGIAGLSAGWWFLKKGVNDFTIIELEPEVGGNSRSGNSPISPYPWGAHYVPVPNRESEFVRELLIDLGVAVQGSPDQPPEYHEQYLCAAPQERLYIHGKWQNGLVPTVGVTASDRAQITQFFTTVDNYRHMRGSDGRLAFTIPLAHSSQDEALLKLDLITMKEFVDAKGWSSPYLRWLINYSCRDDYGAPYDAVSAWAGIHYFASRRPWATNVDSEEVLTWPEGNGWLVDKLKRLTAKHTVTNLMVFNISRHNGSLRLLCVDPLLSTIHEVIARQVIFSSPCFTASSVIDQSDQLLQPPRYSPWMVANITLDISRGSHDSTLGYSNAKGFAWDNVLYHSSSLGYVVANHQQLKRQGDQVVLTYYQPLDHLPPAAARTEALTRTHDSWVSQLVQDLSTAHPTIESKILSLDVWLWGHGMICPTPGTIWRSKPRELGGVLLAHSDQSGISIFEEAQYQGITAADLAIKNLSHLPTSI